jgi:hypothetical protein
MALHVALKPIKPDTHSRMVDSGLDGGFWTHPGHLTGAEAHRGMLRGIRIAKTRFLQLAVN